jgi:hypothetical protein
MRLERAAHSVPQVLDHLDRQAATAHTKTTPEISTSTSGHSDPTLTTVLALEAVNQRRGRIHDAIASVRVAIDLLDTVCREAYRMAEEEQVKPRCIGDGTPAGATCWNIPTDRADPTYEGRRIDDGRCHECGPRWDQRRRAEADARRQRRHRTETPA